MSENALQPIEQKTIIFYDDEITAVVVEGEAQEVYIPLRPLCDYLGVSWSAQFERIKRDMVLSDVVMSVRVTRTDIQEGSKQPKSSEMACLPLDYLGLTIK